LLSPRKATLPRPRCGRYVSTPNLLCAHFSVPLCTMIRPSRLGLFEYVFGAVLRRSLTTYLPLFSSFFFMRLWPGVTEVDLPTLPFRFLRNPWNGQPPFTERPLPLPPSRIEFSLLRLFDFDESRFEDTFFFKVFVNPLGNPSSPKFFPLIFPPPLGFPAFQLTKGTFPIFPGPRHGWPFPSPSRRTFFPFAEKVSVSFLRFRRLRTFSFVDVP